MFEKTSLLVNKQVPEFIREEYPLFISFLEAYYEFLETKQGDEKNDLTTELKKLKNISDVDASIESFENNFFNMFATYFPKNVEIDKAFLLKNILPLYLSKGSETSFKFLFRLLFGEEVNIIYPKNEVLRASDGKWTIENALKVTDGVYTQYIGDGNTKEYILAKCRCPITNQPLPLNIDVYINDVQQTAGFYLRQETKKLYFLNAPADGDVIQIYYRNFDYNQLINNQVTGELSGSKALIEKISSRLIKQLEIHDLYVNTKNILGNFRIGENLNVNVFNNGDVVPITLKTVSSVEKINIIDGGSNYLVGDPVIFVSDSFDEPASAIVSKVFKGVIDGITILDGGAGFESGRNVEAIGLTTSQLSLAISNVNISGQNTSNTFVVYNNTIDDVDPANTLISALDYGLSGNVSNINVNTAIVESFSDVIFTSIGEISNVVILASNVEVSALTLDAEPAKISISNSIVDIRSFGSIGKLKIVNGGSDYEKGDELLFNNIPGGFGIGAAAEVSQVSVIGEIEKVDLVPFKITGTANVTSTSNVMVQGNNTLFEEELFVGSKIMINGETKTVVSINSNTSINVNTTFSETFSNKPVRLYGKYLIGGQGYQQQFLPTVSIVSVNGIQGQIEVVALMGDGENLSATSQNKKPGEIEEITIVNSGSGYTSIPQVDLTKSGDGQATGQTVLYQTYETFPGRWLTSDSILSTNDRKLQGRNYYVDYSYVLSSTIEFFKYKNILRNLLHPLGFKYFAEYNKINIIDTTDVSVSKNVSNILEISGKVSVTNNSNVITGTSTKFILAESLGLISVGSTIAIDSEIRTINSIVSNTQIVTTQPFGITKTNQNIVVISV